MRIYNSNSLGFKPLRKRAQSLRQIRKANIGEPETRLPPPPEQRLVYLDEELAERERKAQEEIERKKMCIAPAYNKGAYQYVSDEEQAKMVGR
ncbi:hypothetical protein PQE64_gp066 [Salmonella phage vB_STy-RN29]|uniref:hypothetical protein n=1 Tax=Salmonella phage vB_STy-RN29 TaxID=2910950 RepID=UPI00232A215A|nr:hypothetical protein PQE64_gp066 [Salmonella phage vB_STy-RN29]UJD21449.1 hypothetical protein RN29_gp066 [Salmonella phage vB_STy-RN29]